MRILANLLILSALLVGQSSSVWAAGFYFSVGDSDRELVAIHATLRHAGFRNTGEGLVFTTDTEQAVKAFQKAHRLPVTGVINEKTYQLLLGRLLPEDSHSTAWSRAIADTAFEYLGKPYRYGGTTPQGFDCSGFVQYIYARHGVILPRTADRQYTVGAKLVSRQQLRAGDLVFFSTTEPGASHSGMYLGDNKFISATSSQGIAIRSMEDHYWKARYWGACRVLQ